MLSIEKLSDEVILRILTYLDTKAIVTCCRLSQRFKRICQDPSLFRSFQVGYEIPLTQAKLHSYVSKYHRCLSKLTLKDCFWLPPSKLGSSLQSCKKLTELDVTGSRISLSALMKILSNNQNLKKLRWLIPNLCAAVPTSQRKEIQTYFMKLTSIVLHFEYLTNFEHFLPVFMSENIFVNEFGLHYLKSSWSNTYGIYIKSKEAFQLHLNDPAMRNRFLHFNLLIMDFAIQAVTNAAETKNITSLLARGNTVCWKHISTVLNIYTFQDIDLSLSVLGKDQKSWLSKLTKLKNLNLSQVRHFEPNLMKDIAMNCPELESLNLSYCEDWINKELDGLEAIVNHCTQLRELNLSCVHVHATDGKNANKLCFLIGQLKNLKALSLPACGLVNNIELDANSESKMKTTLKIPKANPQVSLDASKTCSSYSFSTDLLLKRDGPSTRQSRVCQERISPPVSGLDVIVEDCRLLEDLEIIDIGFHSVFSRVVTDQCLCPLTMNLVDNCFGVLSRLKNLQRLTLAGLSGGGAFQSLSTIASSCHNLEVLSIAHCGLGGHSNTLWALKNALKSCRKLKHFRLDQPYYNLKEDLLKALHNCPKLQTIAFIFKNGKIVKDPTVYEKLFEKCTRLVAFFLFSGATAADSHKIQTSITKRYSKLRPSLCATVLPYTIALTEDGLKNIPHVCRRNVIQFESRIAVYRADL